MARIWGQPEVKALSMTLMPCIRDRAWWDSCNGSGCEVASKVDKCTGLDEHWENGPQKGRYCMYIL